MGIIEVIVHRRGSIEQLLRIKSNIDKEKPVTVGT